MVPVMLTVGTFGADLVVRRHLQRAGGAAATRPPRRGGRRGPPRRRRPTAGRAAAGALGVGGGEAAGARARPRPTVESTEPPRAADAPPEEMTLARPSPTAHRRRGRSPRTSMPGSGDWPRCSRYPACIYFWRMDGEQLEILKELVASVVPLGVLTVVVLAVILFGICTATESAAIGALGALYLAVMAKYPRQVWWWSLVGAIVGFVLGWATRRASRRCWWRALSARTFLGTLVPGLWHLRTSPELRENLKEVDVPHREDHRHGVLALRRLGALLRRVRAARRPGADRALGAEHEPLAARVPDHRAADHLPARLAARVDRDHRDLLPDLHPAA